MVVVLMGVTGVGKTTVGQRLAVALGWRFVDADALHPPHNVEKMRRGEPLSDGDRMPWLAAVATLVGDLSAADCNAVLACSALKGAYREQLTAAAPGQVRFVHLHGDAALLRQRLAARHGHFMPPALLDSQLATLEAPAEALAVDVGGSPAAIVDAIIAGLALQRM